MAKKLIRNENPLVIPFGRAVRVGNFKLWRGNFAVGKDAIECVNVSSLDGAWMVRIPATSQMFGCICSNYATVDENLRDTFLGMVFGNMLNVCNSPSEALHDAFYFLTEMMRFPYMMLPEKEMEKRMKDGMKKLGVDKDKAKAHISKMMEYRKGLYELIERKKADYIAEYERQQQEMWKKEDEELERLHQDEIAEQALETLNKEGED